MKRICAWCNKSMEENGRDDGSTELITHSICTECADNLDFQLGVTLQRYLDSLKIPVVLVDGDDRIILANSAARELAGVAPSSPERDWRGKIYECSHARLPERCHHDIHCSGCTIRFITTETYSTGREILSVPALVNGCSSSPTQQCDYSMSTSMVNGVVHLRIKKI